MTADVGETTDLFNDDAVRSEQTAMLARVAYWAKESAHVLDQNSLDADIRSNPMLNKEKVPPPPVPVPVPFIPLSLRSTHVDSMDSMDCILKRVIRK